MLHDKHNLPLSLKSLNHLHQAWVVQSDDNDNIFFFIVDCWWLVRFPNSLGRGTWLADDLWVVQSDDHGQNENVFFSLWIADDDDDGESN